MPKRLFDKITPWIVSRRLPVILVFSLFLTVLSYLLAFSLRFDFKLDGYYSRFETLWFPLLLLLFCRTWCNSVWGLNQGYWRYATTNDLLLLLKAHGTSAILFTAAVGFLRIPGFPRSVIFIEFALSILFAGGSRFCTRLVCENLMPRMMKGRRSNREVIVLGAGDSGHVLIKHLQTYKRFQYTPVAVLDDNERLQGTSVQGVRVAGSLADLASCLDRFRHVAAVILAIPSLSEGRIKAIRQTCSLFNVPMKRLQAFEDIACRDAGEFDPGLTVESVLEKEVEIEHEDAIRQALRGRRILVTGGGGSIGSEIVRQVLQFEPEEVIVVDHSEFNVFQIGQELAAISGSESRYRLIIGNICDEGRLLSIFDEIRPEVVFHAAAYKHVPLMEDNPYEAFNNNVVGTRNVLRAAHVSGAKRFVFISTDKAVDPSSIMGASKRIAELLIQEYAREHRGNGHGPGMHVSMVRFGNVINSAGSVVPTFKRQILSGGPITVTHPDMERYFMSIREAVRLVLVSGILGEHGEIYILDMGKPIKIVDVAKKMLALYGRRDIPIKFVGLRPGEKLTERLTGAGENNVPTAFRKVNKVVTLRTPRHSPAKWASYVATSAKSCDDGELAELMLSFVYGMNHEQTLQRESIAVNE